MTDLLERPPTESVPVRSTDGGMPARRAMARWAWRLFRREWRQQILILALIVVAVAATFVGAAVATNTPQPTDAAFGTASNLATYSAPVPHLSSDLTQLHRLFGRTDVIENQTLAVPGSIDTFDLRAQNPHGAYGQPMLELLSGRYPTNGHEVALTAQVASSLHLHIGEVWRQDGTARRVVGLVQNPQSLLDAFALVVPGQVANPSTVTVLFDAHGERISASASAIKSISASVTLETPASLSNSNFLNPTTVVLALATLGMVLIALVSVGGFTVLAQRRLRSIGMLGALGATDKNIRMVVRANGLVVGVVGTVVGALLGLVAWLAYRPHLQSSSHHLIGTFALPWKVIGPAMALAVVATYLAASRPARAITRVPVVTALAGRPAPPKQLHRSAVPGVIVGVIAFLLLTVAGSSHGGGGGPQLVLGLVTLIAAIVLLAPLSLAVLARFGRRAPIFRAVGVA